ncbi:hypothetical protein [Paenibacillus antibioticophila]|uniref:hypothetical protein n=1 Tax=Paenibacillus antibioticophila TaxID=1274374 RepID=UPI0005C9FB79|nr:hypothetical protein [Paenibacillus antibioticophila]
MGRNAVVKEQYTILEQYSSQIDDQALMQMNIHYHVLVLESLRLLLGEEKDMQVRVAGDGRQAKEACERELPDLI